MDDFDYLCKLDMDLDLPARYFELLMERMESNPRVGTTSGKPHCFQAGVEGLDHAGPTCRPPRSERRKTRR